MKIETTISEDIRITDEITNYDEACKRLLSEKIILAWIMKSCMEEYRALDAWESSIQEREESLDF